MRISTLRSLRIDRTRKERASLFIAHLERDARFQWDRFTLKDASGCVPIEFEFEDVGPEDIGAYFNKVEGKIEELPTTYLVALTACRTLREGIKSGNIRCDDDAFERSRTRICARLDVDIFLDERIFAHSQNNICATRETCVPDQNALSVKQALFWSARAPLHYGNGALCVPTPTDIDVRGVVIVEQRVNAIRAHIRSNFIGSKRAFPGWLKTRIDKATNNKVAAPASAARASRGCRRRDENLDSACTKTAKTERRQFP